jgi:hypothetical protein
MEDTDALAVLAPAHQRLGQVGPASLFEQPHPEFVIFGMERPLVVERRLAPRRQRPAEHHRGVTERILKERHPADGGIGLWGTEGIEATPARIHGVVRGAQQTDLRMRPQKGHLALETLRFGTIVGV